MIPIKSVSASMLFIFMLSACSSTHTLDKRVTEEIYQDVAVSTVAEETHEPFRFWAGDNTQFLYSQETGTTPLKVEGDQLNVLVLSGGGAKGAFGAGVINGLNDSGSLDEYTIVTGISAGSLIAPFVFVGGDEIAHLKDVMVGINDKMIMGKRNFLNTVLKDAFTNGESLYGFIESVFTDEFIEKIAQQHRDGKRLFIGTTQFDSEELSIWNIGSIANSKMENKQALIHQVLAASASIPGVFPPQFIKVNYKGQQYEELHVDGGMSLQMFFEPIGEDYQKILTALGLSNKMQVHVIRNGMLKMPYEAQKDSGMALLVRSLKSLTIQQNVGNLYQILYQGEVKQFDVGFTYVEDSFEAEPGSKDMFDTQFMNALYEYGYKKGMTGSPWGQSLP
ncbi:patatin-like phospholipase family protein [Shewanella olleyana]|uniref:patatin-like phospholipase family protein n=1 Tax=Shewanella olleyana TaxID=135626 RepID=UPI0020104442|nr:patatin-like phospholipase family protein [Shewanella olleyana]MCL1065780.1 patatin-like phospholipase family protein [Shewanella olleyana]